MGLIGCEQVDQRLRMYVQMAGKSKSRSGVDREKLFHGRRSLMYLSSEQLQEIFH